METKVQNNCVVVIPVYREPTLMEQCSFKQCLQILKNYDITIITNNGVDMTKFNDIVQMCRKSFNIEFFDKKFFEGIKGYNALCLSKAFYQRFVDKYVYMLIYQLDAWVFRDELQDWCDKGYDYVGSPFFFKPENCEDDIKVLYSVGNGGLSLRRTQYCLDVLSLPKYVPFLTPKKLIAQRLFDFKYSGYSLLRKLKSFLGIISRILGRQNTLSYFIKNRFEDYILSDFAAGSYFINPNIPTPSQASFFSYEVEPSFLYKMNKERMPFGCHAFEKYEYLKFWSKFIPSEIDIPNFMKITSLFPLLSSFIDIYGNKLEKEEPKISDIVLSGLEEIPQNGDFTQDDSPFMVSSVEGKINSFVIYRNKKMCNSMELTESEQYSLIAHEFGHIIHNLRGLNDSSETEELFADEIAAKVVSKEETLSVLKKLQKLIKTNVATISPWNFIAPKPNVDLEANIKARIINIEQKL